MHSHESIKSDLLNCDGSCRDINFSEEISAVGAVNVLNFISECWTLKLAISGDGDEYNFETAKDFLLKGMGSLSTFWEGSENPSQLQVFLQWKESDKIFCELTFFPQDLNSETFSLNSFLEFLAKLVQAANSKEYYVRYEDASWRHSEPNRSRSIIFSHNDLLLPIG